MQQLQLSIFWAIVIMDSLRLYPHAQTKKKLPTETLLPAAPDEYQPGCFALEKERGAEGQRANGTVH